MNEAFAIGFGCGGIYVVAIFVAIHLLGWAQQMERERQDRNA